MIKCIFFKFSFYLNSSCQFSLNPSYGFVLCKPGKPLMVMEYWCGWFDVWGEPHHVFHAEGTETHTCHQRSCQTLHTSQLLSTASWRYFRPHSRTSWLSRRRHPVFAAQLNDLSDTAILIRLDGVISFYFIVWWLTDMLAVVSEILQRGISVNFYMFHGGSNFGFMNGAMDFGTYKPQVSSYGGFTNRQHTWGNDASPISVMHFCSPFCLLHHFLADYDAPLSEAGDYTSKYHLLRHLFSQYYCNAGCNTQAHAMTLHGRNLAHPFCTDEKGSVLLVVLWDCICSLIDKEKWYSKLIDKPQIKGNKRTRKLYCILPLEIKTNQTIRIVHVSKNMGQIDKKIPTITSAPSSPNVCLIR